MDTKHINFLQSIKSKLIKTKMRGDIFVTTMTVFAVAMVLTSALVLVNTFSTDIQTSRRTTTDRYNMIALEDVCMDFIWDAMQQTKVTSSDIMFKNQAFYDTNIELIKSDFVKGNTAEFKVDGATIIDSIGSGHNFMLKDQFRDWFQSVPQKYLTITYTNPQVIVPDYDNVNTEMDFQDTDRICLMPIGIQMVGKTRYARVTKNYMIQDVYLDVRYEESGKLLADGSIQMEKLVVFKLNFDHARILNEATRIY